jgi:ATP-dependent Clp protease ATP-binding subunit ClpC
MAGMERFTQRARRVLSIAHQEAERARQNSIGTEHLILGLMDEEGGVAGRVLRDLGMTPERVREMVQRVSGAATNFDPNHIELAAETQQVLEYAIEEARRLGHHYIGTEHILLGLIRGESTGMEVLRRLGVTGDQIRRQTRRVLNESGPSSPTPAGALQPGKGGAPASGPKTPLVDQLATDLTSKAEEKKLDPVKRKLSESFKFLRAAPKTILHSSANPVSAKPPSWKDLPNASLTVTFPRH